MVKFMPKSVIGEIKKLTITKEEKKPPAPDLPEEKEASKVNSEKKSLSSETQTPESSIPSLSQPELLELVKTMVDSTVNNLKSEHEKEIKGYRRQIEGLKKGHENAYAKALETWEQEQSKLLDQLETANKEKKLLEDVFKLTGNPNPATKGINFNTTIAHDADKVTGILKEVDDEISRTSISKLTREGGYYNTYDTALIDRIVRENKAAYLKELETQMRKSGLLQGNKMGVPGQTTKAATTISDIVGGFLPRLEPMMRDTHLPGHVFWQFAETEINHQKALGDTIKVPRAAYLGASTDPTDWELSGGGTFAAIQDDYDPIQSGTVDSVLKEYGMGKASTTIKPVRLTDFVVQYSLIRLLDILNRNLSYNYCQFEDLKLRSLWSATSRILYNNNGEITTTATDVDTGSGGTLTRTFLINLRSYMHTLQILPFADNCYGLVVHPKALSQFQIDLNADWEAPSEAALRELTNILNPTVIPPGDTGKVSGYQGKYEGFHIFSQNAFAIGAAGTEGVQNVTLGAGLGSTLTRSSYAFGDKTIGRGTAEPMQIRQNEVTNYGRKMDFIWRSVEAFTPLDVDPTGYSDSSTVPQQLRVIQIRTLDAVA